MLNKAVEGELIFKFSNQHIFKFSLRAIGQVIRWRNDTKPENLLQLHGKKDKIFWNSKAQYYIDGGGHFMVYTHGDVINSLLTELGK